MILRDQAYRPRNKLDAERQGVRLVMQELNLVGTLSVAENIFLDQMPHRWGWVNYPELHRRARSVMDEVGLGSDRPRLPGEPSWSRPAAIGGNRGGNFAPVRGADPGRTDRSPD